MVNLIIDAIIDNYERKLITSREELTRTSDSLKAMTERYERADDAKDTLNKEVTQLKRDLASAQLDKLRIMDHLIVAVSFIAEEAAVYCNAQGKEALRDALYAIPADSVTSGEHAHIDALVQALDEAEEAPG